MYDSRSNLGGSAHVNSCVAGWRYGEDFTFDDDVAQLPLLLEEGRICCVGGHGCVGWRMLGGGEVQWSCTVASLTGARRRCLPQCPSRYATVAGVHGPIVTHLHFNVTHGTLSSQHHSLLASSLFHIHILLHNYGLSSRCAVFDLVSRCVEFEPSGKGKLSQKSFAMQWSFVHPSTARVFDTSFQS
jgi:hypothetical protein